MTPLAQQVVRHVSLISQSLAEAWATRPCFVCNLPIPCRHREREVELAIIEADSRRLRSSGRSESCRLLASPRPTAPSVPS